MKFVIILLAADLTVISGASESLAEPLQVTISFDKRHNWTSASVNSWPNLAQLDIDEVESLYGH